MPPEEDLREVDRPREGPRRPPEQTRRSRTGSRLAEKIRGLRKRVKRRSVEKRSKELQQKRDRRKKNEGLRELRDEAGRLRDRVAGASSSIGSAAASAAGSASDTPGPQAARREDPAVRAGAEAEAPAPVNASLRPFGPPEQGVGPEQLERMAGGGRQEFRDARREMRGEAPLEQFAAAGGMMSEPSGASDDDLGIVEDDDLDLVGGGGLL